MEQNKTNKLKGIKTKSQYLTCIIAQFHLNGYDYWYCSIRTSKCDAIHWMIDLFILKVPWKR